MLHFQFPKTQIVNVSNNLILVEAHASDQFSSTRGHPKVVVLFSVKFKTRVDGAGGGDEGERQLSSKSSLLD